jgi:hypothetical protein
LDGLWECLVPGGELNPTDLVFTADQVEAMRSEISDDEFFQFAAKHPGTYIMRRGLTVSFPSGVVFEGQTFFQWELPT